MGGEGGEVGKNLGEGRGNDFGVLVREGLGGMEKVGVEKSEEVGSYRKLSWFGLWWGVGG